MIKKIGEIMVDVSIDEGWMISRDRKKIGWCMPFCVEYKDIDENHFFVKLDALVGGFRKMFEMEGEIIQFDEKDKFIKFVMEDANAIIFGSLKVVAVSDYKTKIQYDLALEGKGTFAKIFVQMVRGQWNKRVLEFSQSLIAVIHEEIAKEKNMAARI